jgi:hypothetical protein
MTYLYRQETRCLILLLSSLNCHIVSNDLLYDRRITIDRGQAVSILETAIQNNLGLSFTNIPLEIRQIHLSSINERPMRSQALISEYFNGQPDIDYIYITVYPVSPEERESVKKRIRRIIFCFI